ncbi:hypothetical protein DL771_002662 [Monosporascus sp. 5C6A]|nr:hypothetical protein DL771_002662 [Monosporascus sp. 5C6A]
MAQRLWDNEVTHPGFKDKKFWPEKLFDYLFMEDAVLRVVGELVENGDLPRLSYESADKAQKYWTQVVCGTNGDDLEFRRVLALLLLTEKENCLKQFISEKLGDTSLPLDPHEQKTKDIFTGWGRPMVDVLCKIYQWGLIVPYFALLTEPGKVCHIDLKENMIPPWCRTARPTRMSGAPTEQTRNGGYGEVHQISMHPWHHNFNEVLQSFSAPANLFALKILKTEDRKKFNNEADMLNKFGRGGTHNVRLLATIVQRGARDTYSLLFPWAEADLLGYWQEVENPGTPDQFVWISEQCHGLTMALAYIHNPPDLFSKDRKPLYGRHGDIKPENILWFKQDEGGTLALSDMGLTEVHKDSSRSNIPGYAIPATPTYRPPECDMAGKEGHISRSFDIWTLGCVFLEYIVWMLEGWDGVQQFKIERFSKYITNAETNIFFDVMRVEGPEHKYAFKVKDSVTEWFDDLRKHKHCTQYIHDFLQLIQDKMLIVQSDKPYVRRIRAGPLQEEMVEAQLNKVALKAIGQNEMNKRLKTFNGTTRTTNLRGKSDGG